MTTRSALGCAAFVLALVAGQPAASEVALRCIYMSLTETHEIILYCGDQIDSKSEAIYAALSADLKKFINQNARADRDKIGLEYDREQKEHLESLEREYICGSIYPSAKIVFHRFVSPGYMDKIRKRLESPTDPAEGDCI